MSEQSVKDLFKEAERTGDYLMVQIDNDPEWVAIRWTSEVYDGSPYGCAGFADENNFLVLDDVVTAARVPNDSDLTPHISSEAERSREASEHEREAALCAELDAKAERRKKRASRRAEVESRHSVYFPDVDRSQLTLTQMKAQINGAVHLEIQGAIGNVMKSLQANS